MILGACCPLAVEAANCSRDRGFRAPSIAAFPSPVLQRERDRASACPKRWGWLCGDTHRVPHPLTRFCPGAWQINRPPVKLNLLTCQVRPHAEEKKCFDLVTRECHHSIPVCVSTCGSLQQTRARLSCDTRARERL